MPVPAQNARASTALQAEFNTVGRLRMQVDETIVPVAVVADLSSASSIITRRACAREEVGAVALEFFVARLELPTGVLGIVRRIGIQNGTADRLMRVFFGSSFLVIPGTTADKSYMDGRLRAAGENPAGVLVVDTQIPAMAVVHTTIPALVGARNQILNVTWPFGQNNAFDFIEFQAEVVNEAIKFTIEWEEFPPVI